MVKMKFITFFSNFKILPREFRKFFFVAKNHFRFLKLNLIILLKLIVCYFDFFPTEKIKNVHSKY
ncbi:hypothetical protein BpHYR1_038785 [Brachionus plicatilis]|uniref:Uncharacterized protein n=1 Tax=Brachionus plicatilis TaxID=10195 RepID=A0A3M7SZ21_BRAPC|nr:hypothetical protein BpHYR1_038785 [Brachionus plicatilis]